MLKIKQFFQQSIVRYILLLFLATRLVLTFIGVSARLLLDSFGVNAHGFYYSSHKLLAPWGVWDSGHYLAIAAHGYSPVLSYGAMTFNQANYAFFPLYPLLIRLASYLTAANYYLASLLVANLCFLAAAYFLYRLVELDYGAITARQSLKYLFLLPAAFIFSGAFSESLFLLLLVLNFYFFRQKKWLAFGLSAFLISLSRPLGSLVLLPLIWEYAYQRGFKLKNIDRGALAFLGYFLGIGLFFAYLQYLTGNFTNYFLVQQTGWGHVLSNPLAVLWTGCLSPDIFRFVNAWLLVGLLAVVLVNLRRLPISYIILSIILVIFPLSTGLVALNSSLRYALPIFPLTIALALLPSLSFKKNAKPNSDTTRNREEILIIILALLQGFLMVFWTNGLHLIV